jgi:hypothetical protein
MMLDNLNTSSDYIKYIFPGGAPIRKSHHNFTYHNLYIVLGRPYRQTLFTRPHPHNGLF